MDDLVCNLRSNVVNFLFQEVQVLVIIITETELILSRLWSCGRVNGIDGSLLVR